MKPRVLIVVGPTASGKKAFALQAALRFNGEIVSADSRKVYRYLDIGTAKPSRADRSTVPHHLIDILNPDDTFNAGQWAAAAANAVADIIGRGRLPIISGGTGFYIKTFTDGLSEGITPVPEVRENVKMLLQREGSQVLLKRLAVLDSERAGELHPNDTVRIMRALEIAIATGKTVAELRDTGLVPAGEYDYYTVGITWERARLYERINKRVDAMIAAGIENEVLSLESRGYDRSLTSLDTVGYKEWWTYHDGASTRDDCIEAIKKNTRRYAKRQLTWFCAREHTHWCNPAENGAGDAMIASVAAWLNGGKMLT